MSLFFDAGWFDARLAALGLDRAALAAAAGLDRTELHKLFSNDRAAAPAELEAFARLLGADLVEVTLRSGVVAREADPAADADARIESIEARLDAIDDWLAEFEKAKRKRA
jgi:transcriptional regulator with XRE-family HTH domain